MNREGRSAARRAAPKAAGGYPGEIMLHVSSGEIEVSMPLERKRWRKRETNRERENKIHKMQEGIIIGREAEILRDTVMGKTTREIEEG